MFTAATADLLAREPAELLTLEAPFVGREYFLGRPRFLFTGCAKSSTLFTADWLTLGLLVVSPSRFLLLSCVGTRDLAHRAAVVSLSSVDSRHLSAPVTSCLGATYPVTMTSLSLLSASTSLRGFGRRVMCEAGATAVWVVRVLGATTRGTTSAARAGRGADKQRQMH